MASSRKRFSVAQVIDKLSESDEEDFDDNDSDRDSNYEVGDVEPDDDDADRDTEDVADVADTGDTAASDSDSDAEASVSVASTRTQPSASSSYVWETVANDYVPHDDLTYTDTPGVASSITLTAESLPIEFLHLFFTEEIINKFVAETNRYAEQFLNRTSLKRKSRAHNWSPTNVSEMKQFLGLLFLMGVIKKPCVEDYWSTNSAMATPIFNSTMSRDSFQLILKLWHFCNNDDMPEGDRLFIVQIT